MRGHASQQIPMYYMINVEAELPKQHPLRGIKRRADAILEAMASEFAAAYSRIGRPSIAPEQLLKALLLQALYSIRSEILLMQAIQFNLLYRWFVDLSDRPVWTPEVFCMNRERFAQHDLVRKFFDRIVSEAVIEGYASPDHFTVDGTLIRSWASPKSLRPKEGAAARQDEGDPTHPTGGYRGQKWTNATHESATDPEARLMRKGLGKEAHLCHSGHVLMENRNGLCMGILVDQADGHAERRCARAMIRHLRRRHRLPIKTLGTDKGFDDGAFLVELERLHIRAHVPVRQIGTQPKVPARQRAERRMRTRGYQISQRVRKRVEQIFGWCKTVGGMARTRFVGRWKILQEMLVTAAAYNLLRLARLETVG